ncbi:Rid family hydrolase [Nitratireductor sp. XY-223]|uniref:Rid family hydrolase n=1 Tax=Nitratireductor sp. XY-223 TaxID=2561926 RepID=UPI0010AAF433|nr:Rid family hydrolase [Nitratireductor sp. XY-223]
MIIETVKTGGRFEEIGAYARVKRVGPFVYVAGTTAVEPSGRLHAPGDTYAQAIFIFKRIEEALAEAGAGLHHVVRTRAFLTDMAAGGGAFVRAHGEVFRGIDPVTSGVEAGLTMPGMMIEIEADALITDGLKPVFGE